MAHGVPVPVPARFDDGFAVRAEEIAKRITPKTRAIMLNFPTNPTGGTLLGEELEKVAKLAVEHDLLVLTDEIYSELVYDDVRHESIITQPGMRERTIYLHGFSKAYAMTGYRLGYACAPEPLIAAMMKIHQYSMLCASIISQEAACEALENGEAEIEKMRRSYEQRRNLIVKRFREIGCECHSPRGSFYVFPKISSLGLDISSKDFALGLLEEHNVAMVPGSAFGESGEGFLRACFATNPDQIKTALNRLEEYVTELRKSVKRRESARESA
jgi:aminotransferase